MQAFSNEPILELRRAPHRQRLLDALAELDRELPISAPLWIGDDRREGDELISTDPGNPERMVAESASSIPTMQMCEELSIDAITSGVKPGGVSTIT